MGKVKKLLLIQPHSDDLLFSCSHLLFDDSFEKQVLTIENNPKRIKEDKELYSFLSIKFNHLDVPFDDQSYYGYHKTYKEDFRLPLSSLYFRKSYSRFRKYR